ncbi:MAG: dihydrolipoyl dehydrogenase family protein [Phototrophicaceae bacterium]
MYDYDLIVIGAGSAGLVSAKFAGRIGLKVALIEKDMLGGDCTWRGCVPSKSLLHVAKLAHAARVGGQYGVHTAAPQVNLTQVRGYIDRVRQTVYQHETPEAVAEAGVEAILGTARFTDPHTLTVDLNSGGTRSITGKKFIIATGAHPARVAIPGLDTVQYHTYETIFDNETLPSRLITLGAGPIGMELSQAYARFGAQVTIVADQIMPNDEPEVRQTLRTVFEREGVRFSVGKVTQVSQAANGEISVSVDNGEVVQGDMLLVALGRVPSVRSLDLDKAGVAFSDKGVAVNTQLQTRQPHIYAAGDVLGGAQFTHYAGFQGSIAARNAVLPGSSNGMIEFLPWTTFTAPEAAHTGMTETQARARYGDEVLVRSFPLDEGDRSLTEDDTDGFIKVVYKGNKLLGATVVAERAGEMINEYSIALGQGWGVTELSNTMHVYPSYGQIAANFASKLKVEALLNGVGGRALKLVRGLLG